MQNITPVHCFYVVFYILEFFSPIDRKKIIKKKSICHEKCCFLRGVGFAASTRSAPQRCQRHRRCCASLCFDDCERNFLYITSIFLLNGPKVTLKAAQKRHLMT